MTLGDLFIDTLERLIIKKINNMLRNNSTNLRTNSTKHRNRFENIEQNIYREWVYDRAYEMRNNPTLSEKIFRRWAHKTLNTDVLFQHPIQVNNKYYILDFFFPVLGIAVEIDGSVHRTQREKDAHRDCALSSKGIETIRITNEQCTTSSLNNIFKEKINFCNLMRAETGVRVLGEEETLTPPKKKFIFVKKKKNKKKKKSK